MIPLTIAAVNEEYIIKKIGGSSDVRTHLENLGFVSGGRLKVVSSLRGDLIVLVKDSRIALGRELAAKIMV
ncbi:MAG: ferrous iron transport protein A [Clostridia bacterium]|nr:ferrous iron transport protein A [Clostridia bacterium]